MGLMTEPAWDTNSSPVHSSNYHQKNLKHLRKIQERSRQQQSEGASQKRRQQPVKAFPIADSVASTHSKKFESVQPRLYNWTLEGSGPDPEGIPSSRKERTSRQASPSFSQSQIFSHIQSKVHDWVADPPETAQKKNFLLGHQKTGPFLPSSAAPSVIGSSKRSQDRVPAFNYDDEIDFTHDYNNLPQPSSQFWDVSIEERKCRIQNLISEIYSVQPLCKENLTRKSLQKSIRRFASSDQISEAGTSIAGSVRPLTRSDSLRYKSTSRLGSRPESKISVNNVDKLTQSRGTRTGNLTRVNPKPVLHPTVSKSIISPRPPTRYRSPSPALDRVTQSRNSRQSRSATPSFIPVDDDSASVIARGVDINYIRANVESVSTVGHHRRKEFEAASEASKVTKTSMVLPETYKSGSVPKYLKDRQLEWKLLEEKREREKPDPDCPPNHTLLSDETRLEMLTDLRRNYETLLQELSRFSVRADSIRIQQRKRDIEDELRQIEAKIKVYDRPKVFVPKF